jgi:hypothetical protein
MKKAILVLAFIASPVCAQQWSGVLDPSRAIDWSHVGVSGGIPNRTTVCTALSAGSSAATINAAIQACPAGQVVFLNAGTYNISGIDFGDKSNVVLRGAGANATFLVFSSGVSCHGFGGDICMASGDPLNWVNGPNNLANWTAGYAKGTTNITLSVFTNLKVGSAIILDQDDDASDTGNKYVCQSTTSSPPCSLEGNNNNGARLNKDQQQIVQVVSCGTSTPGAACTSGNITITPGLYALNLSAS